MEPPNDVANLRMFGAMPMPLSSTSYVGLVGAWFTTQPKIDANFARVPLDGVVHMLAQRRRGAVIAHVTQRADKGLPEKERNCRLFLDDAVQEPPCRRAGHPRPMPGLGNQRGFEGQL